MIVNNIDLSRGHDFQRVLALPRDFGGNFKLWRYMTLTKFLLMLESESLYLARLANFDDPFEGTLPKTHPDSLNELQEKYNMKDEPVKALDHHMKIVRDYAYINCWHINEYESAAMWHIYSKTNESIAIQTDFNKMVEEVGGQAQMSAIGYIDYEEDYMPTGNMLYPCIFKRNSFSYEKEFRILDYDMPKQVNGETPDKNKSVDINLSNLIEHVYLAPNSPKYFLDLIESIIEKYGYEFEVIRSKMDDNPFH